MKQLVHNPKIKKMAYIIIGIVIILIDFYVSYKYSIRNVDSDASSELLLGKLLAEEGGICSENWFYSTELRVLNTQLFYKFFFLLTSNWALVRAAAMTTMLGMLFAFFVGIARKYELDTGAWIMGLFLLVPFSKQYSQYVIFDQYYFPHILITMATLLLLVIPTEKKIAKWKICLMAGMNFLLAILAGLGGMRQIIILYLPLMMAVAFFFVRKWRFEGEWKKSGYLLLQSFVNFCGCVAGYLINSKVLIQYYDFDDYSKLQFVSFKIESLEWIIKSYFSFWGYANKVEILSVDGIMNLCGLALGLLFPVAIYIIIRSWKKITEKEQLLVSFLVTNIACHIGIFLFSNIDQKPRYFLPVFFLALPVMAIACGQIKDIILRKGALLLVTGLLVVSGLRGYRDYCTNIQNDAKLDLVQYLLDNDYHFGYGTFWNGNVMTECSNGTIEMYPMQSANITSDVWNKLNSTYWLVTKDMLDKRVEGPVFVLLTKEEMKEYGEGIYYLNDKDLAYENEEYYVYVYASQEDLLKLVESGQE